MKQTIINYAILPQAFKHTILYMQIYTKFFNMFKGNVSVISSDPPCKFPIHNGTLNELVWSSLNQISMFINLTTDFFGFSTKVTCAILLMENILKLSELNTFKPRKIDNIFNIIDQKIKGSLRLSLYIRHWHLYIEGHLKLRLQSL